MPVNTQRFDELREEIRKTISLKSVLLAFHAEFSRGDSFAKCIFHEEKVPSMSVDETQGVFYCFSCLRSGTVLELMYHCVTILQKQRISIERVANNILQNDPEMQKRLGFATIFTEEELPDYDQEWKEILPESHKRPTYITVHTPEIEARNLFLELTRSDTPLEVLDKIIEFTTRCADGSWGHEFQPKAERAEDAIKNLDTQELADFALLM